METYIYPLDLQALSQISGVPRTICQNWSLGRPLRIPPSISVADGRGSKNLYSLADAYVMGMLYELKKAGVSSAHLQLAVQGMRDTYPGGPKELVSGEYKGVTFEDQSGAVAIFPTPICEPHIRVLPGTYSASAEGGISTTYCVVNLSNLIAAINARAEKYWKRRYGTKQVGDTAVETKKKRQH